MALPRTPACLQPIATLRLLHRSQGPAPADNAEADASLLRLANVSAGYVGRPVVFDVSLEVAAGEVVALFGHNGAGKTTTLSAATGIVQVFGGRVLIGGDDLSGSTTATRVSRGLVCLPQERAIFGSLNVRRNLMLGAITCTDRSIIDQRLQEAINLFPRLGERLDQLAGTMSGGEQRMLSIGIALMAGARSVLLDEPSLGLSPLLAQTVLQAVRSLATERGVAILIVEQAIGQTLEYADRVYVMRSGRIVGHYSQQEALNRTDWWEVF